MSRFEIGTVHWFLAVLTMTSCGDEQTLPTPMPALVAVGDKSCFDGRACPCGDGRVGSLICETSVCDCSSCPFAPTTLEWEPCGGEPFGWWELVSVQTDGTSLSVRHLNASTTECAVETIDGEPLAFRLAFGDAGEGATHIAYRYSAIALEQCIIDSGANSCADLIVEDSCTRSACGVCDCELSRFFTEEDVSWTRDETSFQFKQGPSTILTAPYCIKGDTMQLRDIGGLLFTLERVHVEGVPTACEKRSVEQCTAELGCHIGVCVGGATCEEANTRATCTNRQGCTYDTTHCAGTPASECLLQDYGVVPGCNFVRGTAQCVGTAVPCEERDDECSSNTGCIHEIGCVGGPFACSIANNGCTWCNSQVGCECAATGQCVGMSSCEAQDRFSCNEAFGCREVPCYGTATPCEELSELYCEQAPGCHLEVIPE